MRAASSGRVPPTTCPLSVIRPIATTCLLVLATLFGAPRALGQLAVDRPAEPLDARQQVNAFVRWGGASPIDGLRIEVPADWTVRDVHAVRAGSTAPTPLRVTEAAGVYEAAAASPLRGVQTLVVRLTAGPTLGYQTVQLTPLQSEEGPALRETEWQAYVREATPTGSNRAFHLAASTPVVLRRRALPSLDPRDPLTVEMWIKTVGLDEVVLSTWDGDEERPYPLEVVVDGRGRLVFYRGRPGWHEAMTTPEPVADGRWHHAAVVNDPYAGWARLFLDGVPVDSLRSEDVASTLNTMSLALGGRPVRPGTTPQRVFSGYVDELRVWDAARSAVTIRRTMRVPLDEMPEGSVRFSFDEAFATEDLAAVPDGRVRAPSDLSFVFPVESLEASVQQGIVTLTWQTKDRRANEFRVERSEDGQRFETVGTVRADERVGETADGSARFAYTDLPPDGHVLYYRIRQVTTDGPERISGSLKLGLGDGEAVDVAIVGNSPTPFRGSTTITYDLARPEAVRLSVWDVSGTRVAVLVDETLASGRHEYLFRADGLPSGVYFVRLETPSGRAAHKITLTR